MTIVQPSNYHSIVVNNGDVTLFWCGDKLTITVDQYFWYEYWLTLLFQFNNSEIFDGGTKFQFGEWVLNENRITYGGFSIRPWRYFGIAGGRAYIIYHGRHYNITWSQTLIIVALSLALSPVLDQIIY
jgi:hypothetical protein